MKSLNEQLKDADDAEPIAWVNVLDRPLERLKGVSTQCTIQLQTAQQH